jgi:hypothetical protein
VWNVVPSAVCLARPTAGSELSHRAPSYYLLHLCFSLSCVPLGVWHPHFVTMRNQWPSHPRPYVREELTQRNKAQNCLAIKQATEDKADRYNPQRSGEQLKTRTHANDCAYVSIPLENRRCHQTDCRHLRTDRLCLLQTFARTVAQRYPHQLGTLQGRQSSFVHQRPRPCRICTRRR